MGRFILFLFFLMCNFVLANKPPHDEIDALPLLRPHVDVRAVQPERPQRVPGIFVQAGDEQAAVFLPLDHPFAQQLLRHFRPIGWPQAQQRAADRGREPRQQPALNVLLEREEGRDERRPQRRDVNDVPLPQHKSLFHRFVDGLKEEWRDAQFTKFLYQGFQLDVSIQALLYPVAEQFSMIYTNPLAGAVSRFIIARKLFQQKNPLPDVHTSRSFRQKLGFSAGLFSGWALRTAATYVCPWL